MLFSAFRPPGFFISGGASVLPPSVFQSPFTTSLTNNFQSASEETRLRASSCAPFIVSIRIVFPCVSSPNKISFQHHHLFCQNKRNYLLCCCFCKCVIVRSLQCVENFKRRKRLQTSQKVFFFVCVLTHTRICLLFRSRFCV